MSFGYKDCKYCQKPIELKIKRDLERKKYCSTSCRQLGRYKDSPWNMAKVSVHAKGSNKSPKNKKKCGYCGNVYMPTGACQKYCTSCAPDKSWTARIRRYGVNIQRWNELQELQNSFCAICKKNSCQVVDHCHVTGQVRGLLCHGCNMKLSALDTDGWIEKAFEYLKRG